MTKNRMKASDDLAALPESNGQPGAAESPPTDDLLARARRTRDHRKEGARSRRQLDIKLRSTPPSTVFFRSWPDPADEEPVFLLKTKDDDERKQAWLVPPDIAELDHVAPHVREALLTPIITRTGLIYVWARVLADPGDAFTFAMYQGLELIYEASLDRFIAVAWDQGKVCIIDPDAPDRSEPSWPVGQTPAEMFRLAIKRVLIVDPDHVEIRRLLAGPRRI
jgi:hypothetical protein